MTNQNKPRLSDAAKKNTSDRASRLAGAFLPSPPPPAPEPLVVVPAQPLVEELAAATTETDNTNGVDTSIENSIQVEASESVPATKSVPAATTERSKEKRRSVSVVDLAEMVSQPTPEGMRCTRMIMVCDEHHDLLRELSFKSKKPMTAILFNLLELANQALQREKKKGD